MMDFSWNPKIHCQRKSPLLTPWTAYNCPPVMSNQGHTEAIHNALKLVTEKRYLEATAAIEIACFDEKDEKRKRLLETHLSSLLTKLRENPHYTLNCKVDASEKEIKTQYHTLARKYHPDKTNHRTTQVFQMINTSYNTLIERAKNPPQLPPKQDNTPRRDSTANAFAELMKGFMMPVKQASNKNMNQINAVTGLTMKFVGKREAKCQWTPCVNTQVGNIAYQVKIIFADTCTIKVVQRPFCDLPNLLPATEYSVKVRGGIHISGGGTANNPQYTWGAYSETLKFTTESVKEIDFIPVITKIIKDGVSCRVECTTRLGYAHELQLRRKGIRVWDTFKSKEAIFVIDKLFSASEFVPEIFEFRVRVSNETDHVTGPWSESQIYNKPVPQDKSKAPPESQEEPKKWFFWGSGQDSARSNPPPSLSPEPDIINTGNAEASLASPGGKPDVVEEISSANESEEEEDDDDSSHQNESSSTEENNDVASIEEHRQNENDDENQETETTSTQGWFWGSVAASDEEELPS